jgi:hypothetical protein
MSWLKKIASKISMHSAEQAVEDVMNAVPTVQCLTAEPAPAIPDAQQSEKPGPRRYFIKADILSGAIAPPSGKAEPASPVKAVQEDESSTHQRRYFSKNGQWIDNEEERANGGKVDTQEIIIDKRPVDLKTLFPKLSLR